MHILVQIFIYPSAALCAEIRGKARIRGMVKLATVKYDIEAPNCEYQNGQEMSKLVKQNINYR